MTDSKPICYILIGPPAAGKSTWIAENWMNEYTRHIVVSSDNEIERHAKSVGKTYNDVFASHIKKATKVAMADAQMAADQGYNVVIDRTNMTIGARKKFIDIFKDTHIIIGYDFGTPDNIVERLLSRPGKDIPMHIVRNMIESYEAPTLEEGFDAVYDNDSAIDTLKIINDLKIHEGN